MAYSDPEKQREYQRQWMARRRKEWFDAHGPCACGSWTNLEIHHVDPATKVDHKVWSWSAVRRDAELDKCIVLCEQCHSVETKKQMTKTICINGHQLIRENLEWNDAAHTVRVCKLCRLERHRKRRRHSPVV